MLDTPLTDDEKSVLWTWCNCAHGEAEAEMAGLLGCAPDAVFDKVVELAERAQRIYGLPFPRASETF